MENGVLASDTLAVWRARAQSSHLPSPLGTNRFLSTCLSFPICKIRLDRLNSLLPWPDFTTASQVPFPWLSPEFSATELYYGLRKFLLRIFYHNLEKRFQQKEKKEKEKEKEKITSNSTAKKKLTFGEHHHRALSLIE